MGEVENKPELCWKWEEGCFGLDRVPLKFMAFLESQNVTLFGNRVTADVIS